MKANVDNVLQKLTNLRIYHDENDKINLKLDKIIHKYWLCLSLHYMVMLQIRTTVPSFTKAAKPDLAEPLLHIFLF